MADSIWSAEEKVVFKEMVFRELNLLPILVAGLLLVLLLRFLINLKSKRRTALGVSSLAFFERKRGFWKYLPEFLFVVAVLVLILALLNPVLPLVKNKKNIIAKEIMLLLDCSNSMTETWGAYWTGEGYVGPKDKSLLKIHVATKYLTKFIESRDNDALGLIVYSDNAYLSSPLNYRDHQSLISLIRLFGVDLAPSSSIIPYEGSTATGDALFLANEYFKEYGQNKERIIVLFTDGESNHGRDPVTVFEEIKKTGFRVFVLGIDYYTSLGSGEQIAQGARETKGDLFPIETEEDFQRAIKEIDKRVGDNLMTVDEYFVDEPQYFYFAFIALVLFVVVLFLKHLHYFRDLL